MMPAQPTASHSAHLLRLFIGTVLCLFLATSCVFTKIGGKHQYHFAGRLAMSQQADPNIPNSQAESWSAHFELAGNAKKGELRLYTPVGTTVATITWQPRSAAVVTTEETHTFNNLDELTMAYFEQSIPITALFDWLRGIPTPQNLPGWEVDLEKAKAGVLRAKRINPAPVIQLRAIVDKDLSELEEKSILLEDASGSDLDASTINTPSRHEKHEAT